MQIKVGQFSYLVFSLLSLLKTFEYFTGVFVTKLNLQFFFIKSLLGLFHLDSNVSLELEGISQKQRSPKINMSLAKLFQRQGMERYGNTIISMFTSICVWLII